MFRMEHDLIVRTSNNRIVVANNFQYIMDQAMERMKQEIMDQEDALILQSLDMASIFEKLDPTSGNNDT